MTSQHPLTDDRCDDIAFCYINTSDTCDNMRAAADWQLEQVIEWLRKNLGERYIDDGDILAPWIYVESVVIDLKQAMRPTQEENQ